MGSFDLVVARYQESTRWLGTVHPAYQIKLYDKSYGTTGVKLPNVGREAHTYLHHIVKYYDHLADTTVFAQGDPFYHLPEFFLILERIALAERPPEFEAWGLELECDAEGRPHHPEGLPMQQIYGAITGKKLPEKLKINCGAQFAVSKKTIRTIKKHIWERALKLSEEIPAAPWAYERLWPYLLIPKKRSLLCCLDLW